MSDDKKGFQPKGFQPSRRDVIKAQAVAAAAVAGGMPLPAFASNLITDKAKTELKWSKAACRFCGTGCSVMVGTKDGRVVATHGDNKAEVNRGLNCVKGYFLSKIMYGKDRLTKPMLRMKNGQYDKQGGVSGNGLKALPLSFMITALGESPWLYSLYYGFENGDFLQVITANSDRRVLDAHTASDRPYKKPKTLSESVRILSFFKKDGHIDPDLFDLFLSSGIYKRYADDFLNPSQIDEVDISEYVE